jgi:hypothetical protein
VAAGVGEVARTQLGHGEIGKREDAGGAWDSVQRDPGCGVVTGLEVHVATRGDQVSGAVIGQEGRRVAG